MLQPFFPSVGCFLNSSLSQAFRFFVLKLPGQGVQVKYISECIKDFPVFLSDCNISQNYNSLSFPKTVYTTLPNTLNTALLFL